MRVFGFKKNKTITWGIIIILICFVIVIIFCWRNRMVAKAQKQAWQQLMNNSFLALKKGTYGEAERLCNNASKMAGSFGQKDTCMSRSQILLANIYVQEKKFDLAEKYLQDAVVSCEKAVGSDNPGMLVPLDNLANFYSYTLGRYDQEAVICQRILKIVENSTNRDDREIADRAYNLATVYQKLSEYPQADVLYKKALESAEKKDYDVPSLILKMAGFYQQWGKCDQVEPLAKCALVIQEKAVSANKTPNAKMDFAIYCYNLAEIYFACRKPANAEPLYSRSLSIIEKIGGKENTDITKPMIGLAASLRVQRKYEQAEVLYKRAVQIVEDAMGPAASELDTLTKAYTALLLDMNKPEEAKTLLQDRKWKVLMYKSSRELKSNNAGEAKRLCEEALKMARLFDPKDIRLSQSLTFMGEIFRWQGKYDLAEKYFTDAIANCEKVVGPTHPDLISSIESLANFYFYTRVNYKQVELLYLRILKILQSAISPDSLEIARRSRNLAEVYGLDMQYEKAELLYKQALTIVEKKAGENSGEVVEYLQSLYTFYRVWGKYDLAEALAKRALAIREKTASPGPDSQLDIAVCLDGLADIYSNWKKPDKAEPIYRKSIAIIGQINGAENCDLVSRLTGLADALRAQGKFDQAEKEYNKAITISNKCSGSSTFEFAKILENYAELLKDMKKYEDAKRLSGLADSIRKNPATH